MYEQRPIETLASYILAMIAGAILYGSFTVAVKRKAQQMQKAENHDTS